MSDEVIRFYLEDRGIDRDTVLLNARRAAQGLHSLGVRENDSIALLLRNDFPFVEATQAASAVGAYCVPINWHGKVEEILYVINDVKPSVLVAHADLLETIRDELPPEIRVLVAPTPPELRSRFRISEEAAKPAPGDVVWAEWLAGFAPWEGEPRRNRATLIYTSGTTGNPKGVKREPATPEQAEAYVKLMRKVYGVEEGMRVLVTGPLYHSSPNATMRQAVNFADVLVMQARFDAEQTLATIEKHRITHAVMVPTMFVRFMRLPDEVKRRYDVSSLKWVIHTGAPCAPEIKKGLMDWWGPVIYETYGGTEVGAVTLSTPHDWLEHPGSAGTLTDGALIGIYGDNGKPVPPGEPGEIYMRQPAMADFTYLNNEEKRRTVERDGLISVGDIGYLKNDRLYLCDRRSDMVISGGVNIYPAEIENALVQCPGVHDCAVFGIPDDEFGESLAAAVQPRPGVSLDGNQVREYLENRLARYKVPRRIDFHDTLPREESGKIFKRKLRDPFWKNTGRRI